MGYKSILSLVLKIVGLLVIAFGAFCFYLAYWARSLRSLGETSYGSALIVIHYGPIAIPTSPQQAFVMNLNLGVFTLVFGITIFWFSRAFGHKGQKDKQSKPVVEYVLTDGGK